MSNVYINNDSSMTDSSMTDSSMTKGILLSLLAHAGLFYAGLNIYSAVTVSPVLQEQLSFISVELVSEKSSSPVIDRIEEQLKVKSASLDEPEKKNAVIRNDQVSKSLLSEKRKPDTADLKAQVPEVSTNKKKIGSEKKEILDAAIQAEQDHAEDFSQVRGNSDYNAASQQGEYKALYEQTILSKLERVKKYPEKALVRRLEGEVLLSLELTAAGTIEASTIKSSSGYSFFDTEVLSMVKRAGSFPKFTNLPETQKLTYLIPISFKLTQS